MSTCEAAAKPFHERPGFQNRVRFIQIPDLQAAEVISKLIWTTIRKPIKPGRRVTQNVILSNVKGTSPCIIKGQTAVIQAVTKLPMGHTTATATTTPTPTPTIPVHPS